MSVYRPELSDILLEECLLVMEDDGEIVHATATAEIILGILSHGSLIGRMVTDFLPAFMRCQSEFLSAPRGSLPMLRKLDAIYADGQRFTVYVRLIRAVLSARERTIAVLFDTRTHKPESGIIKKGSHADVPVVKE
jgi:hypothetical protein